MTALRPKQVIQVSKQINDLLNKGLNFGKEQVTRYVDRGRLLASKIIIYTGSCLIGSLWDRDKLTPITDL